MCSRLSVLPLSLLAAAILAAPTGAQIGPGDAVVLTVLSGSPQRAGLLDVSLSTGTITPIGRFPSDVLAPLEVAWDPVDGDVLVALAVSRSSSRLVRLGLRGQSVVRERRLADLPGLVTGMVVGVEGDVFAASSGALGGVFRIARNGGTPSLVLAWPDTAALWSWRMSSYAWLAQSVLAGPPVLTLIDLQSGSATQGPLPMTGLTGVVPTDVLDLPTGLSRELISDTQGQLHLLEGFTMVRTLALMPPLPPGGSVAMAVAGPTQLLVLGGALHPYLKAVNPLAGGAWQQIAGPLPGDPVDFEVTDSAGPGFVSFGATCAMPGSGSFGSSSLPRIGSSFQLSTRGGAASAPAHLLLGLSEQQLGGVPLPFALPGSGCALLVSAEVVVSTATDPTGFAAVTLPIPNVPAFAGVIVYAQWLQGSVAALGASSGLAIHIGL